MSSDCNLKELISFLKDSLTYILLYEKVLKNTKTKAEKLLESQQSIDIELIYGAFESIHRIFKEYTNLIETKSHIIKRCSEVLKDEESFLSNLKHYLGTDIVDKLDDIYHIIVELSGILEENEPLKTYLDEALKILGSIIKNYNDYNQLLQQSTEDNEKILYISKDIDSLLKELLLIIYTTYRKFNQKVKCYNEKLELKERPLYECFEVVYNLFKKISDIIKDILVKIQDLRLIFEAVKEAGYIDSQDLKDYEIYLKRTETTLPEIKQKLNVSLISFILNSHITIFDSLLKEVLDSINNLEEVNKKLEDELKKLKEELQKEGGGDYKLLSEPIEEKITCKGLVKKVYPLIFYFNCFLEKGLITEEIIKRENDSLKNKIKEIKNNLEKEIKKGDKPRELYDNRLIIKNPLLLYQNLYYNICKNTSENQTIQLVKITPTLIFGKKLLEEISDFLGNKKLGEGEINKYFKIKVLTNPEKFSIYNRYWLELQIISDIPLFSKDIKDVVKEGYDYYMTDMIVQFIREYIQNEKLANELVLSFNFIYKEENKNKPFEEMLIDFIKVNEGCIKPIFVLDQDKEKYEKELFNQILGFEKKIVEYEKDLINTISKTKGFSGGGNLEKEGEEKKTGNSEAGKQENNNGETQQQKSENGSLSTGENPEKKTS